MTLFHIDQLKMNLLFIFLFTSYIITMCFHSLQYIYTFLFMYVLYLI